MQDVILMITSIFYPDFQKNASESIGCLAGERSYESSPDTEVRKTNQRRIMRGSRLQIADSELLIRVKAAAVNPLELLILTGSVRLIQDYPMPLTLGNECSGVVEEVANRQRDLPPDIYNTL